MDVFGSLYSESNKLTSSDTLSVDIKNSTTDSRCTNRIINTTSRLCLPQSSANSTLNTLN